MAVAYVGQIAHILYASVSQNEPGDLEMPSIKSNWVLGPSPEPRMAELPTTPD
jgi:hypothetical protein